MLLLGGHEERRDVRGAGVHAQRAEVGDELRGRDVDQALGEVEAVLAGVIGRLADRACDPCELLLTTAPATFAAALAAAAAPGSFAAASAAPSAGFLAGSGLAV